MADRVGLDDEAVRARVARLDALIGRLEEMVGPTAEVAMEAVETLAAVYGEALGRVMDVASAEPRLAAGLAGDELVGHLLVLHGLHPDPVEQRVAKALDEVRPLLGAGSDAQLSGIEAGVAQVQLTLAGCGSSAGTTASSVAEVLLAAAPELADVEPVTVKPPAAPALIPVEALLHRPAGHR